MKDNTAGRFAAAAMFFTRLPFWRIFRADSESFKHIVPYWSFCGWLTSGCMALTFLLLEKILPVHIAVCGAIISRLLLTGALHEDGLADFFDGFGGGRTKEDILRIMKDSHIGSYGVISLALYFILGISLLGSLPAEDLPYVLLCADPFCKAVSSFMLVLPYVRKEEESKMKAVYSRTGFHEKIISLLGGLLPLLLLPRHYLPALILPVLLFFLLLTLFRKKIGGYTGDCFGAIFLLCELSLWTGIAILHHTGLLL